MTISVVVADDQPLVRAGIVMLLEAEPGIDVVGEASDGRQAIDLAQTLKPDIVVMDVRMPGTDGVAATRLLCRDPAGEDIDHLTKVLIVTTFSDDEAVYGYEIFRAEGDGILLHHSSARAQSTRFEDARVIGGATYRYALRPYDLAGNRGPVSPTVSVVIPDEHVSPDWEVRVARDPGALEACTAATR